MYPPYLICVAGIYVYEILIPRSALQWGSVGVFEDSKICVPEELRINAIWSYAHHLDLYAAIRLFSAMGYCTGSFDDNASCLTSDGVLQQNLSWGLSSA